MNNNISERINSVVAYDFLEEDRETYVSIIKAAYAKKCYKDETLSDEYIKFVGNPDNIDVKFKYGKSLTIRLSSIDIKASYDYIHYYTSDRYVKGKLGTDLSGNLQLTDISTGEYTESERKTETKVFRLYGGSTPFVCQTDRILTEIMEPVSPENMNEDLNREYNNGLGVDSAVKKCGLSDYFRDKVDKMISDDRHKHLKLLSVEDYDVDGIDVTCGPIGYTIVVNYKGKKYEADGKIVDFEDMDAEELRESIKRHYDNEGEKDERYLEYKNYCEKSRFLKSLAHGLETLSVVASLALGITNILLLDLSGFFILIAIVYAAINAGVAFFAHFADYHPEFTKSIPLEELKKKALKEERKSGAIVCAICMIFPIITLVIFFVYAL